jgi:hypothetical protein
VTDALFKKEKKSKSSSEEKFFAESKVISQQFSNFVNRRRKLQRRD